MNLKLIIPTIPNWPRDGVNFLDITPVLETPAAFAHCTDWLIKCVQETGATSLVAMESRGFPFAAAVAHATGLPLILARKPGKLPRPVYAKTYNTEYSTDSVEIKLSAPVGARPLVVDDLLATGGTIQAVSELLTCNFSVDKVSAAVIVNLKFLPGESVLHQNSIHLFSLEDYV
jgi:adenine phosphoribosyltransferase